jgi:predicted Zn-dependent peptidase
VTAVAAPRLGVEVHEARLDNGLAVVVSPDPRLGFAVVDTWHGVGSMADPPGRSGLAHLAEHVCFDDASLLGGRGAAANATTSFERINFVDAGPVDTLPHMLARVADRVARGCLSPPVAQLARHRDVVVQEIRQREDAARFGSGLRRSLRLLFGADHPFGRPALGAADELSAVTGEDVAAFIADGFGCRNSVVSVVGSVLPEQVVDLVAAACSSLPPGRPHPRLLPTGVSGGGREEVEEGQPAGLVRFTFALPADGDPLADAGEVLMAALAGAPWTVFGARFAAAAGALAVTGEHVRCAAGPSVGMLRVALPPGADLAAVERAVESRLRQVADGGLDDDVRSAGIARCRKQRLALLSGARSRAEELCLQHSWYGDAARINARSTPQVSAEDIQRVATAAFAAPATVVFHPASEGVPSWIP